MKSEYIVLVGKPKVSRRGSRGRRKYNIEIEIKIWRLRMWTISIFLSDTFLSTQ
jgi:hypothetical protein